MPCKVYFVPFRVLPPNSTLLHCKYPTITKTISISVTFPISFHSRTSSTSWRRSAGTPAWTELGPQQSWTQSELPCSGKKHYPTLNSNSILYYAQDWGLLPQLRWALPRHQHPGDQQTGQEGGRAVGQARSAWTVDTRSDLVHTQLNFFINPKAVRVALCFAPPVFVWCSSDSLSLSSTLSTKFFAGLFCTSNKNMK